VDLTLKAIRKDYLPTDAHSCYVTNEKKIILDLVCEVYTFGLYQEAGNLWL
jgi:hypothetical protein